MELSQASSDAPSSSSQNEWSRGHEWYHVPGGPTLHVSSLRSEAFALLLIFATVSVTALNRMRQRIQLPERDEYSRIVARVPADLEQACRRLANGEGWALGDLCRSLIVLGACGSYLTLRSSEPQQPISDGGFSSVLREYLGARAYAPRTGRRSELITVRLPAGVARSLILYSRLVSTLRSHVYARLLRAGLLMYLRSEQRLAESLQTASPRPGADANHGRR